MKKRNNASWVAKGITLLLLGACIWYAWANWESIISAYDAIRYRGQEFVSLGIITVILTTLAASTAYYSLAIKPINFWGLHLIEWASLSINRLLPAGIGGMGTHVQYLSKRGYSYAEAATIAAVNNALGFIVHIILLLVFLLFGALPTSATYTTSQLPFVLSGAALIIFVVLILGQKMKRQFRRHITDFKKTLGFYRKHRLQLFAAGLYIACISLTNVAFLLFLSSLSVVHISYAAFFVVYSMGVLLGAASPTPGGLIGVEAGLLSGLLFYGIAQSEALAIVLSFRFVTFWLPLLPGFIALTVVRARSML